LQDLKRRRKSIFFGSVYDEPAGGRLLPEKGVAELSREGWR
jgi:hypothetical protein